MKELKLDISFFMPVQVLLLILQYGYSANMPLWVVWFPMICFTIPLIFLGILFLIGFMIGFIDYILDKHHEKKTEKLFKPRNDFLDNIMGFGKK